MAMSRASIVASAFALSGGHPADARSFVHIDTGCRRGRRQLFVAVEPLQTTPLAAALAETALTTMREVFAASRAYPAPTALLRAFAAANQALVVENRSPGEGCWDRRVFLGATAIVVSGREAIIAQVPPAQAVVVQDRQIYAFPPLATWRPDFIPETDDPEPDPLGYQDGCRPQLFRTMMAPGDLVVLCSSNVGRALSQGANGSPLLGGDLDVTLDRLGHLVAERETDDAFVAAIMVGGRGSAFPQSGTQEVPVPEAKRVAVRSSAPPLADPLPSPVVVNEILPRQSIRPRSSRSASGSWTATLRMVPALAMGAGAAVFAPLQCDPLSVMRQSIVALAGSVGLRRMGGRARNVPGASSVHRYRGQRAVPLALCAGLPRGLTMPLRTRIGVAAMVGAIILGGATVAREFREDETIRMANALSALDAAVATAAADPRAAAARIVEADTAMAAMGRGEETSALWGARAADLESSRDRAWSLERLGQPTLLGRLPEALRDADAQLLVVGDRVYLAGQGLYEVDLAGERLVERLAPGAAVAGGSVGPIVDGFADGPAIAAFDGQALYRQRPSGRWDKLGLVRDEAGMLPAVGATAGFNDHLYSLAPDGRIVRYATDQTALEATTWASPADIPDLLEARDIAVDGRIYVLLDDGRVLVLYEGLVEAANAVPVTPPLTGPGFFCEAPGSKARYLVDPTFHAGAVEGRVVRFDAGGATQQFIAPAPDDDAAVAQAAAQALGGAESVAILETARTMVFLSGDELWQATLPPLIGA